ncbi:MAG: 5-bromo-4-chloroindolyl phosphate hydrolysis family protein, partial [Lachnospiraceae bacterium]|nr:5-bromo-4-chloroindolyl phosphate hydrolysis family protein [Lachnospiraceae bacterium]
GQSSEEQEPLAAVIAEGHEYIKRIRQANDAIPAEPITTKLYRMEDLLKEIFIDLEKMPQQLPKLHKLMNYYLPTTLKLVNAYEEFEHMSVQGKDVTDAKKEIENTIDTINDAFGELLNKLFMDTALDVTTDAQVLKTMLAKEGLTEGGMEYVNEYR